MNKEFLIDKISRLLGVSASEKEFAFQIFIEKTADVLSKNEALKYPGIGFFYFKEDASKPESLNSLLFVPIMSELDPLADSFFLSFDVKKKNWNKEEFDPSVFSLSIDKSTLPFESDTQNSSDISYHLLKKTIEERVEELISSAMHLENFNISDSFAAGNMENVELSQFNMEKGAEPDNGQSYEEMVFSRMNFEDSLSGFDLNESETGGRTFDLDQVNNSSILTSDEENLHQIFYEENKIEFETDTSAVSEEIMEKPPVQEPDLPFEDERGEINLIPEIGKDYEFVVDRGDEKENLEWSWSQEPNKEEPVLENFPEIISEKDLLSSENPSPAADKNETESDTDPFAELEEVFSLENIVPREEHVKEDPVIINNMEEELSAAASAEIRTSEIPAVKNDTSSLKMEQAMNEEKENNTPEETNPYSEEDNSKRNMLLIGALVVIGLVAVYIIFFEGFGLIKKKTASPPKVQTENQQTQQAVVPDSSKQPSAEEAKPVTNTSLGAKEDKYQKVKESQAGNILREMKSESKVGSNIYAEGGKFYVQVSSWKNLAKAEQEAQKLKAKGNDAFVVKAYIEQFKGTWYRVRVGGFKSKEEAEAFSAKNR